jgi:hypothetical protein
MVTVSPGVYVGRLMVESVSHLSAGVGLMNPKIATIKLVNVNSIIRRMKIRALYCLMNSISSLSPVSIVLYNIISITKDILFSSSFFYCFISLWKMVIIDQRFEVDFLLFFSAFFGCARA